MWHFLAKIHFPCLPQVKGGHFPLVRPSSLQSWHTITIQVYTLVSLSLRRVTTYIRGQSMTNSFLGTHLVPAVDYPPRLLSPLYLLTYIPLLFPRFFIYNLQKFTKKIYKNTKNTMNNKIWDRVSSRVPLLPQQDGFCWRRGYSTRPYASARCPTNTAVLYHRV